MASALTVAALAAACGSFVAACNSSSAPAPIVYGDAAAGSAETPPTHGTDVEAWLKTGAYQKWHCEPAVHASRSPSPHGFDRVCSNDLVNPTASDEDAGAWPLGAAEVKELYTSLAPDGGPEGYAVSLKTAADVVNEDAGGPGSNWYWYERLTDGTIEADGLGAPNTPANTICVACHVAAGSSAAYTPTPGGRDFIYTPVP
jgi:hypothetical protein